MNPKEKTTISPEVLERCKRYAILDDALEKNGITKKDDVRYREVNGRIEVTINGEYYGIWDTMRRTFVD